jgi:hypothetical protein
VSDRSAIVGAAARFWTAWTTAVDFEGEGIPPIELVIEVHEAALQLIRATGAKDLRGAYAVLDELVLEIKRADPALR